LHPGPNTTQRRDRRERAGGAADERKNEKKKERRTLLHRQRTKNAPRRRIRPRSSTGAGHPLTVHRFVVVFFFFFFFPFEDASAHQDAFFRMSLLRSIFFPA
jgi:hypothetical protein